MKVPVDPMQDDKVIERNFEQFYRRKTVPVVSGKFWKGFGWGCGLLCAALALTTLIRLWF